MAKQTICDHCDKKIDDEPVVVTIPDRTFELHASCWVEWLQALSRSRR